MAKLKKESSRREWLDLTLFWLSVIGCVVAVFVSCVTHDRESAVNNYLYVAFVVPAVMFFGVMVFVKMRRVVAKKNAN